MHVMIERGRPPPLFPKKLKHRVGRLRMERADTVRLHGNFARSLRGRARSPISIHAKLGLTLASWIS